jgi:hypothetical protein
MRRIALVALALGAASFVQLAQARAPGATCGRHQGHTLAQGDSARVYTLNDGAYGCAIPNGVVYKLGSASVCNGRPGRAAPVALSGRIVAYGLATCGIDTGTSVVVVRRLTNGKRLHRDASVTGPVGAESFETVESLALEPSGSDAWITVTNSVASHGSSVEVHAHDSGGAVLLDSGAGIDPRSLRLAGSKLTWRHDGKLRSAQLS